MQARDLITIEKANGARLHAIRARVHPHRVVILDRDNPGLAIPLERGDHITRTTPHGLTDTYEVTLPNYTTSGPDGSEGYQAHVRYIHARPSRRAPQGASSPGNSHTSIEVRGDHAQIRMHSPEHTHHTVAHHHTGGWRESSPYRLEEDARSLQALIERLTQGPDGPLGSLVSLNQRVIELNGRGHSPEEIAQELLEHPDPCAHDARHGLWHIVQQQGSAMANNLGSNAVFAMLMYVLGFGA